MGPCTNYFPSLSPVSSSRKYMSEAMYPEYTKNFENSTTGKKIGTRSTQILCQRIRTTYRRAYETEMDRLTTVEARRLRSRCWQSWFLPRLRGTVQCSSLPASGVLPAILGVPWLTDLCLHRHVEVSLCAHICIRIYNSISHSGIHRHGTFTTVTHLNVTICKDSSQTRSHSGS